MAANALVRKPSLLRRSSEQRRAPCLTLPGKCRDRRQTLWCVRQPAAPQDRPGLSGISKPCGIDLSLQYCALCDQHIDSFHDEVRVAMVPSDQRMRNLYGGDGKRVAKGSRTLTTQRVTAPRSAAATLPSYVYGGLSMCVCPQQQKFLKRTAEELEGGAGGGGGAPAAEPLTKFSVEIVQQLEFSAGPGTGTGNISTNVTVKAAAATVKSTGSGAPGGGGGGGVAGGGGGGAAPGADPAGAATTATPSPKPAAQPPPDLGALVECKQEQMDSEFVDLEQCAAALEKDANGGVTFPGLSDLIGDDTSDEIITSDAFNDLISEISDFHSEFMKEFDFDDRGGSGGGAGGGGGGGGAAGGDAGAGREDDKTGVLTAPQAQQQVSGRLAPYTLDFSKAELSPAAQTLKQMAEQHQHKAQLGFGRPAPGAAPPPPQRSPYDFPFGSPAGDYGPAGAGGAQVKQELFAGGQQAPPGVGRQPPPQQQQQQGQQQQQQQQQQGQQQPPQQQQAPAPQQLSPGGGYPGPKLGAAGPGPQYSPQYGAVPAGAQYRPQPQPHPPPQPPQPAPGVPSARQPAAPGLSLSQAQQLSLQQHHIQVTAGQQLQLSDLKGYLGEYAASASQSQTINFTQQSLQQRAAASRAPLRPGPPQGARPPPPEYKAVPPALAQQQPPPQQQQQQRFAMRRPPHQPMPPSGPMMRPQMVGGGYLQQQQAMAGLGVGVGVGVGVGLGVGPHRYGGPQAQGAPPPQQQRQQRPPNVSVGPDTGLGARQDWRHLLVSQQQSAVFRNGAGSAAAFQQQQQQHLHQGSFSMAQMQQQQQQQQLVASRNQGMPTLQQMMSQQQQMGMPPGPGPGQMSMNLQLSQSLSASGVPPHHTSPHLPPYVSSPVLQQHPTTTPVSSASNSQPPPDFSLEFLEQLPSGDSSQFSAAELLNSLDAGSSFNFQDIL
ncbi:neurogenic protein mastermind-like [Schistocerca serialis cubense]|uniref:neurogenic protein mastermind-like n=1 Tax=Schistocerca serialis cubense TaxID=2023355 RepID=UPI00214F1D57|nr:neurogenic protein mastermind-like [Schistocerca serialis cubense]